MTGDVLEPIPANNGSQASDAGVLLRNIFRSPVKIDGWFKAAGVVEATFIKGSKGGKVAVIGQGMAKVQMVASGLKNPEVFKPSQKAIDNWNELLKQYEGQTIPDEVVKETHLYRENVEWINNVKKQGYHILDTGGGNTSTFYNMEKEAVYGSKKNG